MDTVCYNGISELLERSTSAVPCQKGRQWLKESLYALRYRKGMRGIEDGHLCQDLYYILPHLSLVDKTGRSVDNQSKPWELYPWTSVQIVRSTDIYPYVQYTDGGQADSECQRQLARHSSSSLARVDCAAASRQPQPGCDGSSSHFTCIFVFHISFHLSSHTRRTLSAIFAIFQSYSNRFFIHTTIKLEPTTQQHSLGAVLGRYPTEPVATSLGRFFILPSSDDRAAQTALQNTRCSWRIVSARSVGAKTWLPG